MGEVEAVERFRRRVGVPELADVHTHFMFDAIGPMAGIEWGIAYRHEEHERTALLRQFGVRAFTAMLYPHKAGMAPWLNEWSADFARLTPDCLHTAILYLEEGMENDASHHSSDHG